MMNSLQFDCPMKWWTVFLMGGNELSFLGKRLSFDIINIFLEIFTKNIKNCHFRG